MAVYAFFTVFFKKEGIFIDPKVSSQPGSEENFQKKFFTNLRRRKIESSEQNLTEDEDFESCEMEVDEELTF